MPKAVQTPGSVLKSLMTEFQLNPNKMAKEIGLSNSSVRLVLFDKSKITVNVALRLAKYFDKPPAFWLDLQREFDLQEAAGDKAFQEALKKIARVKKPDPAVKKEKKAGTGAAAKKGKPAAKKSALSEKRKTAAKKPGAKPPARSGGKE